MNGSGNVYFVKCGEFVKIGFAVDVQARLRDLQIGNPQDLEVVAVLAGALPSTERLFHRLLHDHRHRGEWFKLNETLSRLISHIAAGGSASTELEISAALMVPTDLPEPLRDVFVHSFIYGRADRTACQHLCISKREFRARREAVEKYLEGAGL